MSLYSHDDEEKIRTLALAREWMRSGLLDDSQIPAIEADLHVDLKQTNLFLRIVLFVFTALIIGASIELTVIVFQLNDRRSTAALSFVTAIVCYGLAEYLVRRFHLYRFGIEEALAVGAGLSTTVWALVMTDIVMTSPTLEFQAMAGLAVGALVAFAIYRRFGFLYAALISILCVAYIPVAARLSLAMERSAIVAILLAVITVVRLWSGADYKILQAAAWAGVYLALNLQTNWYGAMPGTFYWLTYGLTWALPIVGFYFGLRDRDRPFIDVSLGMALVTLTTNKAYLGLTHQPTDPILFGALLMVCAIVLRRWLARAPGGERFGFTPVRILRRDRQALSLVGTASAAFQSGLPSSGPAAVPSKPDFGGGRSGGAGATGSF